MVRFRVGERRPKRSKGCTGKFFLREWNLMKEKIQEKKEIKEGGMGNREKGKSV